MNKVHDNQKQLIKVVKIIKKNNMFSVNIQSAVYKIIVIIQLNIFR